MYHNIYVRQNKSEINSSFAIVVFVYVCILFIVLGVECMCCSL